jgi:tetratricopeptide (TPR) repeat protein
MNAAERDDVIARALTQYGAGQLDDAAASLDALLAACPDDAEALDLSGLVAIGRGQFGLAVARISRAVQIQETARFQGNLGVALGQAGRHDDAIAAYRRALALRPDYPEAQNNLGISFIRLGQPQAAEHAFRKALALRPDYADALANLGDALQSLDRLRDAVASYERALALNPALPRAALGQALRRLGQGQAALAAYRADAAQRPVDPEALNNLAAALADAHNAGEGSADTVQARERRRLARLEEAREYCARAIALRPDFQEAYSNLGNILRWLDRAPEAEAALRRAIALRPSDSGAYNNLGLVLQEMDRYDEARAVLDLAIGLAPEDADIHYSLAAGLLRQGRLEDGWREYEWRFRIGQAGNSLSSFVTNPPWRGEPAAGRTLMLFPEQGLGDTIQFARYATLIAERGMRVVVAAQGPLVRLLQTLPGVAEGKVQVINQIGNYPPYDLHCPMLSLPRAFGTVLGTVPKASPYLAVPREADLAWADLAWADHPAPLPSAGAAPLRVGIVWGGNARHINDGRRSLALSALSPLFRLPGVQWFSLQAGDRATEIQTAPPDQLPDGGILDLAPRLTDFAETAAAVARLDLVISADTAVAHLAGAMGRPVWVMLPRSPDWRWLAAGTRSPWYPSMRLFRQDQSCRWPAVVASVTDALAALLLDTRRAAHAGDLAHHVLAAWAAS